MRIALDDRTRSPARDQAYVALREAIVSAELAPGARLSENGLAERLGVSRTPVREALARLREERLVAVVPQLGTFVTHIAPGAVADAQFVRESLECNAIRLTTERVTDADLTDLYDIIALQERAEANGDAAAFDHQDDALHHRLCDLSGRDVAWRLSQRARGQLDRVRRLSMPEPGYRNEMIAEHRAVLAALADRNPDAAEHALRHHLRMVLSYVPDIRRAHPEYFEEE